jgi:hypothetical protein
MAPLSGGYDPHLLHQKLTDLGLERPVSEANAEAER